MLAAASRHHVWVLTDVANVARLHAFLKHHPLANNIHVEGVAPSAPRLSLGVSGLVARHFRHWLWQRHAARKAIELNNRVGFDVVHHVTIAAYWLPVGASVINRPFVWGPIGGGVDVPWRLIPALGAKGVVEETLRFIGRRTFSKMPSARRLRRAATVVFVQNPETKRRIDVEGCQVRILPNAISADPGSVPPPTSSPRRRDIALVGRLISLKGTTLAVKCLYYLGLPDVVLRVYGSGPEKGRMIRLARRLGVEDRIQFVGHLPRPDFLKNLARTGVVIHPAIHDEAPLSVAEALTYRTPVVLPDHGGCAVLPSLWEGSPHTLIPLDWPDITARRFAAAAESFLMSPPPVAGKLNRPSLSFGDSVLDAYEAAMTVDRMTAGTNEYKSH
jgi:glycosyltransferase involved in cell wall biosynthesis